ncbi:MAG TPA: phosphoribosyltransferase [Rhizomicrobium sp.]|nr:phosphoribosyltransferase [Rhizomicrobium sp.]
MPFSDRKDAGRKLAAALSDFKGQDCLVLALPRGGVPVAAEVALSLHAPLDILLVRKIGVPDQPELAMGAVVDGGAPVIVRNPQVIRLSGVSERQFETVCAGQLKEIERRRDLYLRGHRPMSPKNRVTIVIDDGIATGATMRAALQATRAREPRLLVLATPVAAPDTLEMLRSEVDRIVCLESPDDFGAVGRFYSDFEQTTDEEVVATLARLRSRPDVQYAGIGERAVR